LPLFKPEDAEAQDILMLINTGAKSDDQNRLTMRQDDFSMITPEKMLENFKHVPEALENTQKIVELCNFEFKLGKTTLPYFELSNGKTPQEHLKSVCQKVLEEKRKNLKI